MASGPGSFVFTLRKFGRTPTVQSVEPHFVQERFAYTPGATRGQGYTPGATAAEGYTPGAVIIDAKQ